MVFMKTKKLLITIPLSILLLLVAVYYSFMIYSLSTLEAPLVIVNSLNDNTSRIPRGLARYWLLNMRDAEKDIADLEGNRTHLGIGFILNNDRNDLSENAKELVDFYLSKGADINHVGFDGFTALHTAVIGNEPKKVKYLLGKGADPNIKVGTNTGKPQKTLLFNMTALDVAEYLQKKDPDKDFSEVIKILEQS